jgi:peptidoglycan-N-acetylglucosamine deacetylase
VSHSVSGLRNEDALRQADARLWRPAPAIRLSAAFHVAGLAALAYEPLFWPYIGSAFVANHAALAAAGMIPRSSTLGPNLTRLPPASARRGEIALTFDDGPDPAATLPLLDVLDRHGAKASFFCVGAKAAAHPDVVREIARRGHSIENHSNRHHHAFAAFGMRSLHRDIEAAQEILRGISGHRPVFFRAPMGLRSPLLDPVLARLGLTYVSWTRRGLDALDGNAGRVFARLARGLAAGDLLLLHDGASLRARDAAPVTLSVLPLLLERIAAAGLKPVSLRTACHDILEL